MDLAPRRRPAPGYGRPLQPRGLCPRSQRLRLLPARTNVIAALGHSYGQDMAWYQLPRAEWARAFGCGGFFFQCDIELPDGTLVPLHNNESWRHQVADAWQRDVPAGAVGFPEG